MAEETGSASSIQDLADKLVTFAVANGWTEDEHIDAAAGQATLHQDDCYISLRWDNTDETDLALYQSLGWTGSSEPHEMDDDSGNGDVSVPINSGRRVNFESVGPYTNYWFYASEATAFYLHVVVEVDSGRYRHFGFGLLDKIGTWAGGEYCYGHFLSQNAGAIDLPSSGSHSFGLDTLASSTADCATLHIEDFEGQTVDEKWAVLGQMSSGGVDRAGEDRLACMGGSRGGWWGYALGWMPMVRLNAYKPFTPIPVFYRDVSASPDTWILLGHQSDVMIVNMRHFNPGDEITVGGDTWVVFPWVRKQYLEVDTEESWNAGIAYRKFA